MEVLSDDVLLGKKWVMKVNMGINSVDIFGKHLRKGKATFLRGIILYRLRVSEMTWRGIMPR